MSRTVSCPRVVVVGAGLAGTATAIRMLHFARRPVEIVLLERRTDYRSAGVAYHRNGNPWDHVFNIQAGRMSAFREDVLDFVHWANREADRGGWPAQWAEYEFTEPGPAPRRIFQDYLEQRLAEAAREAYPGVLLREVDGEAVDLVPTADGLGVELTVRPTGPQSTGTESTGAEYVVPAAHVVLATGLELKDLPFATEVLEHPRFLRHPYSADGVGRLAALPPEAEVVIVGSVLSAYDSAGLLLRQGHTGGIRLVSRTGTMFRAYPDTHEHGVLHLPCPSALLEPYRDREEFLGRVRAEWEAACAIVAREYPDIAPEVVAERVAKAWEPHLPAALDLIPSPELRALLDEFGTAIAALRVGAVQYTIDVIERSMDPGPVSLLVGAVQAVAPAVSGRLEVTVATADGKLAVEADLVVSNFGRESDYLRVDGELWRNLLRRGLVTPHERTGRGLDVDHRGVLLTRSGAPAGPLTAVGPLREGDEIVRNGRTGAFAFNLAAIKNHSIAVAAHVIEQLELPESGAASASDRPPVVPAARASRDLAESRTPDGTFEEAADPSFAHAVKLEVRRMATRTRVGRQQLDARLDALIGSLTAPDGTDGRRRLQVAVSRSAVRRLTDVSMTPRQLRRHLEIADTDDTEDIEDIEDAEKAGVE
ncbi:putative NAD(P)/FAD-binding protein YdhS [Streptomyces sp. 1114.5]|uniref:FAD/NAD(P)-binding protein n=1 Tax=Streptomyces sp. 1114.5 TaxID=1938830 RepID=UPI000EAE68AD|nr:FAD/NAD(P)-binding protein [Streptomyces sp. 1114.5]RKT16951.1 putative NAD(P)/FAD-binding protein YdhS [Streptomyces sp. 1114.5]